MKALPWDGTSPVLTSRTQSVFLSLPEAPAVSGVESAPMLSGIAGASRLKKSKTPA